jgi:hypothetical protein
MKSRCVCVAAVDGMFTSGSSPPVAREQRSAKARGMHRKVTGSDNASVCQELLRGSSRCDPRPPLHKSSLPSSAFERANGRESTNTPSKYPQANFARLQRVVGQQRHNEMRGCSNHLSLTSDLGSFSARSLEHCTGSSGSSRVRGSIWTQDSRDVFLQKK